MTVISRTAMGSGHPAAMRPVRIMVRVQYPGKAPFLVCTRATQVDAALDAAAVRQHLDGRMQGYIDKFFAKHFPDKIPVPVVIEYQLGQCAWVPDADEWRRCP